MALQKYTHIHAYRSNNSIEKIASLLAPMINGPASSGFINDTHTHACPRSNARVFHRGSDHTTHTLLFSRDPSCLAYTPEPASFVGSTQAFFSSPAPRILKESDVEPLNKS